MFNGFLQVNSMIAASNDSLRHDLHGIAVYNPDLLSEQELKAVFIARRDLLERLTDGLRADRPVHSLIVGVRGMGKTTLLRRLKYAIHDEPALATRWLPLVFPEEQYNVARLSDFYLNCLDALSDTLESLGDSQHMREVDQFIEELEGESEATIATAARQGLQEMSRSLGRGFVLLVDSVERILDDLTEQEGWAFRELLSDESGIVLIGASTQAVESTYVYDQPFYDFFSVTELSGFTADETERVLRTLAEATHNPQVIDWIDADRGRLKTLNNLSGGNPRTVVLLFQLLVQGVEGDVRSDLERLLDMCTPLYKARFEELPAQGQQILDALAMLWDPASAAQVAAQARLDVTTVSSQLARLVRQGVVQKVALPPAKRIGFQIAERFFNIWYLMRASRRVRRRLLWLAQFLKMFYTEPERRQRASVYLHDAPMESGSAMRHAEYGFALAQSLGETEHSVAVEYRALALLNSTTETRKRIHELLDLEGEDHQLKPVAERLRLMSEAKESIFAYDVEAWPGEIDRSEFWRLFGGSLSLSVGQKHQMVAAISSIDASKVRQVYQLIREEKQNWAARVFRGTEGHRLLDKFYDAVASGYLDGPADVASAAIAAQALELPGLPVLVAFWAAAPAVSGRSESESEDIYRQFLKLVPESTFAWHGLGYLLSNKLARYEDAEQAYRKAIEIDPKFAYPWNGLGNLLSDKLARYEDAEQAYRKAIEIDPKFAYPWNGLGNLLSVKLARYEDAEQAYRKAIEIDPDSGDYANSLAWLLYKYSPQRLDEAERLARHAFERLSDSLHAAHTYATILVRNGRWFAAMEPARRFLEIDDPAFFEACWPDIVIFFREAAMTGHAEDSAKLLHECGKSEQWRPLVEALMAVAEGSTDRLLRLAPEMRMPATELHKEIG
jgi:tetratricopeptide (TPR) repeat protein